MTDMKVLSGSAHIESSYKSSCCFLQKRCDSDYLLTHSEYYTVLTQIQDSDNPGHITYFTLMNKP